MDFEKEMQKSLKVIFQNIQALEDSRVQLPGKFSNDPATRGKCKQRQSAQKRRLSDLQVSSDSDVSRGSARSMSTPRKNLPI